MFPRPRQIHGEKCVCRILAAAVGCPEEAVNYHYCARILRKRWIVECDHRCAGVSVTAIDVARWHELGPLDPVKRIILGNV